MSFFGIADVGLVTWRRLAPLSAHLAWHETVIKAGPPWNVLFLSTMKLCAFPPTTTRFAFAVAEREVGPTSVLRLYVSKLSSLRRISRAAVTAKVKQMGRSRQIDLPKSARLCQSCFFPMTRGARSHLGSWVLKRKSNFDTQGTRKMALYLSYALLSFAQLSYLYHICARHIDARSVLLSNHTSRAVFLPPARAVADDVQGAAVYPTAVERLCRIIAS